MRPLQKVVQFPLTVHSLLQLQHKDLCLISHFRSCFVKHDDHRLNQPVNGCKLLDSGAKTLEKHRVAVANQFLLFVLFERLLLKRREHSRFRAFVHYCLDRCLCGLRNELVCIGSALQQDRKHIINLRIRDPDFNGLEKRLKGKASILGHLRPE